MSRVLTFEVHLPMSMGKVNAVLERFAELWPRVKIDLNGPNGWLIRVGPEEE